MSKVSDIVGILNSLSSKISENKFDYAKLINSGKIYRIDINNNGELNIIHNDESKDKNDFIIKCHCVDDKDIGDKNNTYKNNQYVIDTLTKLKIAINNTIQYSDNISGNKNNNSISSDVFNIISDDMSNELTEKYKKHPMIIINSKFSKPICLGVFTKMKLETITQYSMKVEAV
jgi:hypothetical protein